MATAWKPPSLGASERCPEVKLMFKKEFSSCAVLFYLLRLAGVWVWLCGCVWGVCGEEVELVRNPSCSRNRKNRNLTSLFTKYQPLSRPQLSYRVDSKYLVGGKKKMSEVFKHVGPHMHPSMASWAFFFSPHGLLPPFSLPFYQSIFIKLLSWKDL